MEIHDEKYIQIFHTLEKFERINRQLHLHQNADEQDSLAIEQFQSLKDDLVHQLQLLLAELDVPIMTPAAA